MDSIANTSNDSNQESVTDKQDVNKKQQFTKKQRMDMYAFCVLELEVNGNTVSIKKQQKAIKKLLNKGQEQTNEGVNNNDKGPRQNLHQAMPLTGESNVDAGGDQHVHQTGESSAFGSFTQMDSDEHYQYQHNHNDLHQTVAVTQPNSVTHEPLTNGFSTSNPESTLQVSKDISTPGGSSNNNNNNKEATTTTKSNKTTKAKNGKPRAGVKDEPDPEALTLLQLQQEIAVTQRCYSDYQKTQVLTAKILKAVQKRFAKYYPDTTCPSRTTIKHVFEKCIEHGSVDNVKNPRKATKIPHGDEVEYLLMHEPQMSLRQMARELNVSTGTVSRRCKALGLVPESVTIKHQQMATAKRQKQIKQLKVETKGGGKRSTAAAASRSHHHNQ